MANETTIVSFADKKAEFSMQMQTTLADGKIGVKKQKAIHSTIREMNRPVVLKATRELIIQQLMEEIQEVKWTSSLTPSLRAWTATLKGKTGDSPSILLSNREDGVVNVVVLPLGGIYMKKGFICTESEWSYFTNFLPKCQAMLKSLVLIYEFNNGKIEDLPSA